MRSCDRKARVTGLIVVAFPIDFKPSQALVPKLEGSYPAFIGEKFMLCATPAEAEALKEAINAELGYKD